MSQSKPKWTCCKCKSVWDHIPGRRIICIKCGNDYGQPLPYPVVIPMDDDFNDEDVRDVLRKFTFIERLVRDVLLEC